MPFSPLKQKIILDFHYLNFLFYSSRKILDFRLSETTEDEDINHIRFLIEKGKNDFFELGAHLQHSKIKICDIYHNFFLLQQTEINFLLDT